MKRQKVANRLSLRRSGRKARENPPLKWRNDFQKLRLNMRSSTDRH